MDITKLREEYEKEKSALDKLNTPGGLKDKIEQFEADLDLALKNFRIKNAELEYAKSRNDKASIPTLTAELETIKKQVGEIKTKLDKAQAFLSEQQAKVDSKFEDLSKDPETKKKLDTILYKRYDRKKRVENKKLEDLKAIKEIIDKTPRLQKRLEDIEKASQQIKTYNGIIKKFSGKSPLTKGEQKQLDTARSELPNIENSLNISRKNFVDHFVKNYPNIDKKLLETINSYSHLDRQINGAERSIANYDKAMENLSVAQEFGIGNPPKPPVQPNLPVNIPIKPSWRHPFKRIKYNIEQRKSSRNSDPVKPDPGTPDPKKVTDPYSKSFKESVRLSKDEYDSAFVKDYREQYDKNLHKAATENRKSKSGEGR